MARVNRVLATELDSYHFATALAMLYEEPGRLSLVSAGHPYPVAGNKESRLLEFGGMALAVDSDATYDVHEVEVEPGGILVAYTDGLTEARSGGELFGEKRVTEAVEQLHDVSSRGLADYLIDESLRHAGGRFADDVAVLVLKRAM